LKRLEVSWHSGVESGHDPTSEEANMFKHILLPTDGSVLSETAIKKGVEFAKEISAKVSGLTVTKPFHVFTTDVTELEDTKDTYAEDTKAVADQRLSVIEQAAKRAGISYEVVHKIGDHPWEEIIKTVTEKGCDVIFMASHGRRGIAALVIGSETNKVLTHTKIPVLVYR
jgi:nucleotide-binding universal stress UspA family protein